MAANRRRRGRPSKLTPEIQAKICEALANANFRRVASLWAGIPVRVFSEWMQRGRNESEGVFVNFRHAVIEAEKKAETSAVALILKAAATDPKHAQWWLTRRFPKRWAKLAC